MLILVTGPRRSGCTTLARAVAPRLPGHASVLYVPNPARSGRKAPAERTADVTVLDCSGPFSAEDLAPWAAVAGAVVQVMIGVSGDDSGPPRLRGAPWCFLTPKHDTERALGELSLFAYRVMLRHRVHARVAAPSAELAGEIAREQLRFSDNEERRRREQVGE